LNEAAMPPEATEIARADVNEERGTLEVRWGDGHESAYPLAYLRGECPCASCRTEREEARRNPLRVLRGAPPSAVIADVEPVGRYGMRITWSDGHGTGIYTFEYLREICPCDRCRAARPPDGAPYVQGIHIPG
jgi:DUF971 family protein